MILQAYSVRDGAVEAFMPPIFARHIGEIMRSFSDAVNDPKHAFFAHVEDFTLFHIGVFDDSTGLFAGSEPRRVCAARDVVQSITPFNAANVVKDAM